MPSKNFGGGIHTLVLGEEGTYIAGKLPSDVTVGGLCELLEIEGRPK